MNVNRKLAILLFVVLLINTARYTDYVLEGSRSPYYPAMLLLHVIALVYLVYEIWNRRKKVRP